MNPHEVLKRILADVRSDPEQDYEFGWESFRAPEGMNLTGEMVFITLVCGLGFSFIMKPFEKTLWSIPILFREGPFRIEDAKFGLRFEAPKGEASAETVAELSKILGRGFRLSERLVNLS